MCFYVPVWCVIAYEVRVYAALYKQLSAMTRLASATATMREDARREAAARGGGGDMEDSGSDDDDDEETGGPRGDDDAATAATLRRLLRRLGAYPVILICAWFFPTLNRVVNMFKGGDTTGDVYALYVLQAIWDEHAGRRERDRVRHVRRGEEARRGDDGEGVRRRG